MRNWFPAAVVAATLLAAPAGQAREIAVGWSSLEDPQLAGLIERALAANTDIREAAARVEAARAASGVARRDRLPTGGVVTTARRASLADAEAANPSSAGDPVDLATAGLEVGWELDLFGRLRAAERAARAREAGARADADALRISVTAEVARTYFLLRAARERHAIRMRYRDHQAEIVSISGVLVTEGRLAAGEHSRAQAELAADTAETEAVMDEVVRLEAALAVLLGEVPGRWHLPEAADLTPMRFTPVAIPAPQEVLLRRPDVRAADQRLRAEHHDVGVAAAARYPRLDLAGVLGFLAGGFADLGRTGSDTWSIAGVLSWNIVELPRLSSRLEVQEAEASAALAAFDRVVLRAFEDAENALRRYDSAQRQAQARLDQARHARGAADAAQARYDEGATSYLDALQARRDSLQADMAAADAVAGQRVAVVGLLKALAVPVPAGTA